MNHSFYASIIVSSEVLTYGIYHEYSHLCMSLMPKIFEKCTQEMVIIEVELITWHGRQT